VVGDVSKDSPTAYHARTISDFVKSYIQGYDSLDEASNIVFSANNLANHKITVPSFIYDVKNYLAKAKIQEFSPGSISEQSQLFSSRQADYQLDKKHPQKGVFMFDGQMWEESKKDPKLRRKLLERFFSWQMPTIPRANQSEDAEPHPIHDLNMFHVSRSGASPSASAPMLTQFMSYLAGTTDGENNYTLIDKTMHNMGLSDYKMHKKENMGKWNNAQGDASWTTQIKRLRKDFEKEYLDKFKSPPPVNEDRVKRLAERNNITEDRVRRILQANYYKRNAIQFKLWELRGVPRDEVWKTKTNADNTGLKTQQDYKQATRTLKQKSENVQNAGRVAGFWPMYLGLNLLPYEDALKVCEWFLDGAGNTGEGKHDANYDDRVIDRILGNNARGWLTRHTQAFANALHGVYSGAVGTNGHNSLVGGKQGRNPQADKMAYQDTYDRLMGYRRHRGREFKETLNDLNFDINHVNDIMGQTESVEEEFAGRSLLDMLGGKLENQITEAQFNNLPEEDRKNLAKQLAIQLGPKGSTEQHQDFLNNIKHLYRMKDYDYDPYKGNPEVEETILYHYAHALGGMEGAMGQAWSHLQDLFDEAFPMVFTSRQGADDGVDMEERVLPSSKRQYTPKRSGKRNDPVKFNNSFQFDEGADPITQQGNKRQLERAMENAGYDEDEIQEELARYQTKNQHGKYPTIRVEYGQGDIEDQSEYMLDALGDMELDDYLTYDSAVEPLTLGQSALIAPVLSHTPHSVRNPNHFSADFRNTSESKSTPHGSPLNTINATRDAAMNYQRFGGQRDDRRTKGHSFRRDIRGRDIDNENTYSSMLDPNEAHNRALIVATLLFQKHHSITDYNQGHHDSHNRKQNANDIKEILNQQHEDPFQRGSYAGALYRNELLGAEIPDTLAIYDKEEYENAIAESKKQGAILKLPTPLKDNIEDRFQLENQLFTNRPGEDSFHHNDDGKPHNQLGLTERGAQIKNLKEQSDFVGNYKDGEGDLRSYVIKRTPLNEYQDRMYELRQMGHAAHDAGETEKADLLNAQAQKQAEYIANELGDEPPITTDELRDDHVRDARETHRQAVAASRLFKPLLLWSHPELFKNDNQAWADTKMLAHLCESFMRSLNPTQREKFFTSGVVNSPNDGGKSESVSAILKQYYKSQGMEDLAIENELKSIRSDIVRPIKRKIWKGQKKDRNHENFDKDGKISVADLLEKYVNGQMPKIPSMEVKQGQPNQVELVKKIFEAVRKELPSNATTQDFLDALHARYVPHNDMGINLANSMTADALMDFGQGGESVKNGQRIVTPYSYGKLTGGHHHNNELKGSKLISGGESVKNAQGYPHNMDTELRALNSVFRHVYAETRGTSHGVRGDMNKTQLIPVGGSKKWYRTFPQKMNKFIEFLGEDTVSKRRIRRQLNDDGDVHTGGMDIQTHQLPPVHSCRYINKKFGRKIRPSIIPRIHELKQNVLTIDSPDLDVHSSKNYFTAALDNYGLRDFHPELQPYDPSRDNNINLAPVGITQNQTVNSALPVFQGVNTGEELVRAFDYLLDDTLILKDGRPVPIKAMHRIYDFSDLKLLRGFSGDWVISHIPDGEPVIVQRKDKKNYAYNADMEKVDLSKTIEDEMAGVYEKDFVVHAILSEDKLYIIDLLKSADETTHNMPAKDRIRHLRAKFESSEHIKLPEPYNTKRADDEGLEHAVSLLRDEAPTDILLRDAEGTYMRGELRHPKWIVLSKEKKVDVIILDRKGTNYRIGVGPIMHPEHYGQRAVSLNNEHYMDIGHAKGPRGYDKGEYVSVLCTGATKKGDENPVYTIRSARIDRDASPQAADSVESLSMLVNDAKVPHKVRLNKGNIHIMFPAIGDEVIYKAERVEQGWFIEPTSTMWGYGEDYLMRLAEDMRPHWSACATILLKESEDKMIEPEYDEEDEVKPEAPAGHTKDRKHVLPKEEEVIKRGLEMIERGLDRLQKEKITHTGVEGLGIDFADADVSSPRGATENINDDTLPDFDPASREYKEKPAKTKKKTARIRTTAGEEGITDNRGNLTIDQARI
jgi:hypothetical protein